MHTALNVHVPFYLDQSTNAQCLVWEVSSRMMAHVPVETGEDHIILYIHVHSLYTLQNGAMINTIHVASSAFYVFESIMVN